MKPKANLGLAGTGIPDKIQKARIYATRIDENPSSFPNASPSPAELRAGATALETSYEPAQNGVAVNTTTTSSMHDDEAILDALVVKLSHYVEDLPGCTPALITLLGMVVKGPGGNYGGLFGGKSSTVGCASLRTPKVKGACYLFQKFQGLNPPTEADWQFEGISTHVTYEATGLTSVTKYWFRVIPIVGQVQGTPSAAFDIVIK